MMRRTLSLGAVAATLLAGAGTAFAQAVVVDPPPAVYIVPAAPPVTYYDDDYDDPPPPRVIREYRYYVNPGDEVVVVRPRARGCGPQGYWDGYRCVYARW